MLQIQTEAQSTLTLLRLHGEIDQSNIVDLRARLLHAAGAGRHLVLAMADITYLGAAGLRVLAEIEAACRARGRRILVAQPSYIVRRVIELTDLDRVLPCFPSVDAAVHALRAGGEQTHGC